MNAIAISRLLIFGLTLLATAARAEDIDIFKAGGTQDNAPPNVLIFLDNTSNWSSNSQQWDKTTVLTKCGANTICQGYVAQIFGDNSSLKQGQVEVGALKLVLNELTCNAATPLSFNVGLMILSTVGEKGTYLSNAGVAGFIRQAVLPLNNSHCATLLGDLDHIYSKIQENDFKAAANANYEGAMFEAFKYFGGHSNPAGISTPRSHLNFGPDRFSLASPIEDGLAFTDTSKSTYKSPITSSQTTTCNDKNFLLLVGNTWPNRDDNLLTRVNYAYTASAFPFASGSQPRLGDVWAQFLASTDVSPIDGKQSVRTYTLNVYNASPDASQTTLLKSMAQKGGGSYYQVGGNLYDLVNAFRSFFISINAQNSTYSPPAVNLSSATRGVYLNQIYLGMFRPALSPRWFGNLKLYQLGLDAADDVVLVDANGTEAGDSSNGFIANGARSFWTHGSTFWAYRCGPAVATPDPLLCGTSPDRSSDAPDGAVVEKGAAGQMLRDAVAQDASNSTRKVYTCVGCSTAGSTLSSSPFTTATVSPSSASNQTTFAAQTTYASSLSGNSGKAGEVTDIINWMRGVDNIGENTQTANRARPSMPGDILHAQPVAVNYNADVTNCAELSQLDQDVVVYYASNDGLLHALQGGTSGTNAGKELWAFLPEEFFGILKRLRDGSPEITFAAPVPASSANKPYSLDGNLSIHVTYNGGTNSCKPDRVWLYLTLRRGGRFIYALDVTDKSNPKFLWKRSNADSGYSELGQTWSELKPFLLADGTPALIFGAGYDPAVEDRPLGTSGYGNPPSTTKSMGRGIFIVNAQTGAVLKFFGPATQTGQTSAILDSIPSDVAVVKNHLTGVARYAYVGDTGGHVWRVSLLDSSGNPTATASNWSITKIASLGNPSDTNKTGAHARKFLYPPNIIPINNGYALMMGSGDREKPFDTTVQNRFYRLNDDVNADTTIACEGDGASCDLFNATSSTAVPASAKGWYIDFASTGEKTVGGAVTDSGITFFPTNTPNTSTNSCEITLGTARMYALQAANGGAELVGGERSVVINSGGFPATPKLVTVAINKTVDGVTTATNVTAVLAPPGFIRKRPTIQTRRSITYRYREGLD